MQHVLQLTLAMCKTMTRTPITMWASADGRFLKDGRGIGKNKAGR